MDSSNYFKELMPDGREVTFGIDDNNMYFGEIRDFYGDIESATHKATMTDVHKWIEEHN